jgi:hypothetical protein
MMIVGRSFKVNRDEPIHADVGRHRHGLWLMVRDNW